MMPRLQQIPATSGEDDDEVIVCAVGILRARFKERNVFAKPNAVKDTSAFRPKARTSMRVVLTSLVKRYWRMLRQRASDLRRALLSVSAVPLA